MDFSVSAQPTNNGVSVISVRGEVDVYTAPKLREEIHRRMDDGAIRLVVDLADVAYMDSSGLGVLIGALKRAREAEGDLIVAAPNPRIARILDVTGLSRIFNVHPTVADAVQAVKGPSA
ncbi:MAG TPA: STAS domain-containing protein [Armatimonadota bacterium]|jgi:anti-sigma B factor antagonist